MLPGLPNPWVILGAVLFFMAAVSGAYLKGHSNGVDGERAEWVAKQAEAEKKAREKLDAALAAGRTKESALVALNTKTEKDYADSMERINGLRIANGRLVAAHGGLYDKNGRPTGSSTSADPASPTPGSAGPGPTGCRLSGELSEFLQSRFYDADAAATFAGSCKAHVVELRSILASSCAPIAP